MTSRPVPDRVEEPALVELQDPSPGSAAQSLWWLPYAAFVVVAVGAGVGVELILGAGTLERPAGFAALAAWTAVGFTAAGAVWRAQRPSNRLGWVLLAMGLLGVAQTLQGAAGSVPFTVGILVDLPLVLLAWYAVLAFPTGRLDRAGRAVMAGALGILILTFVPWVLTSPDIEGGSPLAACSSACPENALMIGDGGRASEVFWDLFQAARLIIAVAVAALLVGRLIKASAPRRRSLAPVAFVAVAWVVAFGAYGVGVNVMEAGGRAELALLMCIVVARALLPLAFLLAPLLARAFAGVALGRMAERLGAGASVELRERVISDALDDPRLRLAFWLPAAGAYVDRDGRPIEPAPARGLAWTPIGAGHPPPAALVHDAALSDEPELLRAAGQILSMALDNTRLHEDLEESAGRLELSRSQLVRAETSERRRLERELHDRTQQQLVALRIRLGLAVDRVQDDPDLSRLLAQLGADLETALTDVRGLARDLYPPLLADEGLQPALAAAARRAGAPPSCVRSAGIGRYPEQIEAAVYFVLAEGITAATAAPGITELWISLSDGSSQLRFELGRAGHAPPGAAERLPGMTALVDAVGGQLRAAEGPRGWVVAGTVPVP